MSLTTKPRRRGRRTTTRRASGSRLAPGYLCSPGLAGCTPADILRITRVGFEVRVVVGTEEGREVSVVTTRAHARALGLHERDRVWLTPSSGAATVRP